MGAKKKGGSKWDKKNGSCMGKGGPYEEEIS